jgi:hypothetical protein
MPGQDWHRTTYCQNYLWDQLMGLWSHNTHSWAVYQMSLSNCPCAEGDRDSKLSFSHLWTQKLSLRETGAHSRQTTSAWVYCGWKQMCRQHASRRPG